MQLPIRPINSDSGADGRRLKSHAASTIASTDALAAVTCNWVGLNRCPAISSGVAVFGRRIITPRGLRLAPSSGRATLNGRSCTACFGGSTILVVVVAKSRAMAGISRPVVSTSTTGLICCRASVGLGSGIKLISYGVASVCRCMIITQRTEHGHLGRGPSNYRDRTSGVACSGRLRLSAVCPKLLRRLLEVLPFSQATKLRRVGQRVKD